MLELTHSFAYAIHIDKIMMDKLLVNCDPL